MLAEAERQSAVIRIRVQEQCDNVNTYMEAMMMSIDNLAMACTKTREIANAGFSVFPKEEEAQDASGGAEQEEMSEQPEFSGNETSEQELSEQETSGQEAFGNEDAEQEGIAQNDASTVTQETAGTLEESIISYY